MNNKGFRTGKKLSKADVRRRIESYNGKIEEYSKLSLEELKTLYSTLKGAYREACIQVTQQKLQVGIELLHDNIENKEEVNNIKTDENV